MQVGGEIVIKLNNKEQPIYREVQSFGSVPGQLR